MKALDPEMTASYSPWEEPDVRKITDLFKLWFDGMTWTPTHDLKAVKPLKLHVHAYQEHICWAIWGGGQVKYNQLFTLSVPV